MITAPFDPFAPNADSPGSPARRCFAVTPDDSTELEAVTKAIYVGGEGDITLRPIASAADVTFRNVPAGAILDIRTANPRRRHHRQRYCGAGLMGRLGFGFGSMSRSLSRGLVGGAIATLPPQISPESIAADGWQATVPEPTDLSLASVPIQRSGFDNTGAAVTHDDALLLTKRVRQVWPDNAEFTDDSVALSDYVYASDTIPGAVNNSALASPKPIAAWTMPGHSLVGDSAPWEMVAFHRDARQGRQVACVRVRANDGTTQTAWQYVFATAISTFCEDANPLAVYGGTIDITALATGKFWLEGEVFPWLGTGAAVLKSEDQADRREFSRRWFHKDTALLAAPPLAYVEPTGNDGTGVVSATETTARANPFLTVAGALTAAAAAPGLRIRISGAVNQGAMPYRVYTVGVAALVIERDPDVTRAAAVLTINARFNPQFRTVDSAAEQAAIRYRDLTVKMGGNYQLDGNFDAPLAVQFHNVACDLNNASFLRNLSHVEVFGMAATGHSTGAFQPFSQTSSGEIRILRGLTCDVKAKSLEGWVTLGCALTASGALASADPAKGFIAAGNRFLSPAAVTGPFDFKGTVSGGDLGPFALVQNVIEVTHIEASAASVRLSGDSDFGNITHAVIHHNTTTGIGALGRWNMFYDEHPSVTRFHTLISCKGNIITQFNTKGDIFTANGARTGNFAVAHGVGCAGNWSSYAANAPSSEHPDYSGPGSVLAGGDPGFADYQGTGGTIAAPVAGAGGGDYALTGSGAARGILAQPVLAFDLTGGARGSAAQAAGAYA